MQFKTLGKHYVEFNWGNIAQNLIFIIIYILQGATGSSVYSIPNAELLLSIDLSVVEFPRENLHFVEVLGEGQFGEVCLESEFKTYMYAHLQIGQQTLLSTIPSFTFCYNQQSDHFCVSKKHIDQFLSFQAMFFLKVTD